MPSLSRFSNDKLYQMRSNYAIKLLHNNAVVNSISKLVQVKRAIMSRTIQIQPMSNPDRIDDRITCCGDIWTNVNGFRVMC